MNPSPSLAPQPQTQQQQQQEQQAHQSSVNQPPRIFGSLSDSAGGAEASSAPQSLPADYFTSSNGDSAYAFAVQDEDFLHFDHSDPKRRRIAKACDACRKKKIRCDAKPPRCTNCENYKTECVFTHVEKKRNPPKGAKYIEGLENRLQRMEGLLRMTGVLNQDDPSTTDLSALEAQLARRSSSSHGHDSSSRKGSSIGGGDSSRHTPQRGDASRSPPEVEEAHSKGLGATQETSQKTDNKNDVESLADMMCSLMTNNFGETKFIGSSSGFSIFSPKGIQWINEKTGDGSFQQMLSHVAVEDTKWLNWKPEVFDDLFSRPIYQPLPQKKECLGLVEEFFEGFNRMVPLYHEPTFRWLVDKQYTDEPFMGSGWWASLNVALAITYRIRVIKHLGSEDLDTKAWAYMKNALAVLSQLTLKNTDLFSVQALIGMGLFMQATPNPQPSFSLTGSAIRLAHSIGLHKKGSGFGLNKIETEQRKRVFWISYMLDKDMSLRSGRPPMQDESDWNVDLPDNEPEDGVGVVPTSTGEKANLFRALCEFSLISSKVYQSLYSVKASKQSDGQLLSTIGELDRELEEWKEKIPLEFRPDSEPNAQNAELLLQVVNLSFAYYNCLMTIHRMSIHHGYWTNRLSSYALKGLNVRPLNPRVYSSALLCVQAARASINLIKYIPQGDYAYLWLILYYPVSSMVTLFANVLQNPQDPRARADLKLMNVVTSFLSRICVDESTGSLKRMQTIAMEFERIATVALNKAEREMTARQKRKQEEEREKMKGSAVSSCGQGNLTMQQQYGQKRSADALQDSSGGAGSSNQNQDAASMDSGMFKDAFNPTQPFSPLLREMLPNSPNPSGNLGGSRGLSPYFPFNSPPSNNENSSATDTSSQQHPTPGSLDSFFAFSGSSSTPPGLGASKSGNTPPGMNNWEPGAAFQQPFLPQDLWSMPMTFEWDWAAMDNANNDPFAASGGKSQ